MNTRFVPPPQSLALIAGPTASGKSALALALAEATGGTIINADASQVYRDLAILSARPSQADMKRAPHRLFGTIDGVEACSAARWAGLAKAEIEQTWQNGSLPILVGGTGLYIRTLLDGIAPVPPIDPVIREEIRALPVAEAHAALSNADPGAARRLNAADTTRVARALEVVRSTGRTLAEWQKRKSGGIGDNVRLAPLILLPPRDWLQARTDTRFSAMIEEGAIDEVQRLLDRRLDASLPVMRAIGVREIAAFLAGEIDRETMIDRTTLATRQYAKRQYTWFAHQPPGDWRKLFEKLNSSIISNEVIKLQEYLLTH